MADRSGGIMATLMPGQLMRMGRLVYIGPSRVGRIGPFVSIAETGQLCFLATTSHYKMSNLVALNKDEKECGHIIREIHFHDEIVFLVKIHEEYIPKELDQIFASSHNFTGLGTVYSAEHGNLELFCTVAIFADQVHLVTGNISSCALHDYDSGCGKLELLGYYNSHPEFFGSPVYIVDDEYLLHFVGIAMCHGLFKSNICILMNSTILNMFSYLHGSTSLSAHMYGSTPRLPSLHVARDRLPIRGRLFEYIQYHKATGQIHNSKSLSCPQETWKVSETASMLPSGSQDASASNMELEKLHEWDIYLQQRNIEKIESLLRDGHLPNRNQIQKACKKFLKSSEIVGKITDKICTEIKRTAPEKILKVWAGYRHGDKNDIVFVVVTKEEKADLQIDLAYDLEIRGQTDFSLENRSVIYRENELDLFPNKNVMLDVQRCINRNLGSLTKEHSNITIISGSSYKSRGYMESEHQCIERTCIVLYVHIKGIIPVKEKEFPKSLSSETSETYNTDVREGYVDLKAGGWPDEIHKNVKMGCKIGGMESTDESGTLGGFLEHPKYGLCGLTCAHVLVGEAKGEYDDDEFICYQPNVGNEKTFGQKRRFGCLKLAKTYAGDSMSVPPKAGLDYALVKIDEDRRPVDGDFPKAKRTEWETAGFDFPMTYTSGKVFDFEQTHDRKRNPVIKYGARTGVTCGSLAWYGSGIVQAGLSTLLNQIQINHTKTNEKIQAFSEKGDSGSLVFMVDNQNNSTAIGMLTCGSAKLGCSFITPIKEILDDNDIGKMKSFYQE